MKTLADRATNTVFALACVVVVIVGSFQLYDRFGRGSARPPATPPVQAVSGVAIDLSKANILRHGDPPLVLVEFSDFQCPFCGKHARDTFKEIRRRFVDNGTLAYAFMNSPIEAIHPLAVEAGAAAECAGRSGKYWEMHDTIFRSQSALTRPDLIRMAGDLGLAADQFGNCLPQGVIRVREEAAQAQSIGVNSTPTFFLAKVTSTVVYPTTRISGALPLEMFVEAIEAAIRRP